MIAELKPYENYKESNVAWIGKVPTHWETLPNRAIFMEVRERDCPNEDMLSVTITKGVVRQESLLEETSKKDSSNLDRSAYKRVMPGDIAYNKMRAWQGAVGASVFRGIVSPAYVVLRPRRRLDPRYCHYLLRTPAFAREAERRSYGITSDMWSLRPEHFKLIHSCIPPVEEQAAIVRFIDHADRKIKRYIRAKRKLIALLNEQKQIRIHSVLSGCLSSNGMVAVTGNPWFPKIPSTWSLLPLRRLISRAVDGPHFSPSYQDTGIPFISARNIKPDKWALGDAKYISDEDYREFSKRVIPMIGDVLYTKGGTTGIARVVDLDFPFQVWVHVAVLKVRTTKVDPYYLALVLNSPKCYEQSQLFTKGATNQDLGLGRMKDIVLPVPPIGEQHELVIELQLGLEEANQSITTIEREIGLLLELRTRLLSDVVTGKLDVREAAAQLPADEPETESADDTEAILEDDDAPEDAEPEDA